MYVASPGDGIIILSPQRIKNGGDVLVPVFEESGNEVFQVRIHVNDEFFAIRHVVICCHSFSLSQTGRAEIEN